MCFVLAATVGYMRQRRYLSKMWVPKASGSSYIVVGRVDECNYQAHEQEG